jgi:YVTN family beta-propeller protein
LLSPFKIKRKYLLLTIESIAILAIYIVTITSSYQITAQLSLSQQQPVMADASSDIGAGKDEQTGLDIPMIQVEEIPSDIAVDPETNRVYVDNRFSDSVSVIDSSDNKVLGNIREGISSPSAIAVDPGLNRLDNREPI